MKPLSLLFLSSLLLTSACGSPSRDGGKVPVILISDLYYPGQDIGDNVDLLTPYSLESASSEGISFPLSHSPLCILSVISSSIFCPIVLFSPLMMFPPLSVYLYFTLWAASCLTNVRQCFNEDCIYFSKTEILIDT